MSEATWDEVDGFISGTLLQDDPALTATLAASAKAGLPNIQVSVPQGELLHLLAKSHRARRVLEIGTLGGYSSICIARALPADGQLITLEASAHHAEVARANIDAAGLSQVVDVRVGKALDTLPKLAEEVTEPFDLFFIDADKANNPHYFSWALRLSRPGSVIIVDNVVRDGGVLDAASQDPDIIGTRELFSVAAAEPSVQATAIQTVGSKGYDGFLFALVESPTS
jgi:predicted O-methyltransferase YrrM